MVAGYCVPTWGPAAPSLTCPQTPAQRREAGGKGRFRPPPQVNPLGEWREALVGPRAYFTMVPGNVPTSGSVVTTPDILARHVSATVPPQLIKRSPVSTYHSNNGQVGTHMFHVKPWADTINVRHRERHPEFTPSHGITDECHRVSRETRPSTIHKPPSMAIQ